MHRNQHLRNQYFVKYDTIIKHSITFVTFCSYLSKNIFNYEHLFQILEVRTDSPIEDIEAYIIRWSAIRTREQHYNMFRVDCVFFFYRLRIFVCVCPLVVLLRENLLHFRCVCMRTRQIRSQIYGLVHLTTTPGQRTVCCADDFHDHILGNWIFIRTYYPRPDFEAECQRFVLNYVRTMRLYDSSTSGVIRWGSLSLFFPNI